MQHLPSHCVVAKVANLGVHLPHTVAGAALAKDSHLGQSFPNSLFVSKHFVHRGKPNINLVADKSATIKQDYYRLVQEF